MIVPGHEQTRQLTESVWYPDHDPRTQSAEYKKVHHHLVYELDEPCWVCGVRQSQLPAGQHMETHHWHVEWALANRIDIDAIVRDFPDAKDFRHWLDSEGNMLVLCSEHHRHGLAGIHEITYPAWVAQRWLRNHEVSKAEAPVQPS